jgi:hypothetical protein
MNLNEWQPLEKHHLHALIQIKTSLTHDLMTWIVFYFTLLKEVFEKPVFLALHKIDKILFSSYERNIVDKRFILFSVGQLAHGDIIVELTHPMFRFKQSDVLTKEAQRNVQFTFYLTFNGPELIIRKMIEDACEKIRLLRTESRRSSWETLSQHENRILFSCNTLMPGFIALKNTQCHCIDCGLQPCVMSLAEMWH